ncbi:MAG: TraR/DksA C4-type zinc finger protein [Candidatus Omnitrophota bacterium]
MNKKDLEKYRKALEKEKGRFLKSFNDLEESQFNTERATEPTGVTTHPADLGTDNFERDLNLGLLSDSNLSLQEVEEALARIAKGIYGKCEKCGREIEVKRLAVVPHTRYCFACQTKMES